MSSRPIAAALLAAVLLGTGSRPAPLITYSAPAGARPTGPDRIHPVNAVLPNGRIAAPAGTSLFVGANPLGLALTPDGRYAIVSNDAVPPNSSLAVVNTKTMQVVDTYKDPSAAFFIGVAAVRDPSDPARTIVLASDGLAGTVRLFDLDAGGQLTPEGQPIALPSSGHHAVPAGIAITPDSRTAYVADNLGNAVVEIDLAARTASHSLPVGDFPFDVAAGGSDVLAAGTGLSTYAPLSSPAPQPSFAPPAFDPAKSSSLTVYQTAGGEIGDPATVRMDPQPDGLQIVGGAAPGAIVLSRNGNLAYVALANVDRVAVVSLAGEPQVVRGLDLRLYPGAPYGAVPSAEALSPNGKRLYVALAGLNAVAVLDAQRATRYRYGLIPTAWFPVALALSREGRYLYVLDAKGVNGWGMLQRIDLRHTSLVKATLAALRYNRTPAVARYNPVVPPLRSGKRSDAIDHVVYVALGAQNYDAVFGDLKDESGVPYGNGDASLNLYPESVTPNLHALARTYALADNFYASDSDADVAKQFGSAGDATLYQQLVAATGGARAPMDDHGDDPEDYGRGGYFFNAMARAGLSFRDYGALLRLSGYDGLGYRLDVPGLAALNGNVDLQYPSWNPAVTDAARATEFQRDMQRYVQADTVPSFTYIWLPAVPGKAGEADADRALGAIVDYLSHTPHWSSTAIFIVPEGSQGASDHVDGLRTYAIVVSPLARRGYVGDQNLSMASILKTEDEIFGLPAMTLNDLLASDLSRFFTDAPAPEAYQAR
ncbi:MAG TPA: bifunctional YncE family protein/alkaline phosphatase family protein [Candidatus Babeliales bacterium]|nr:bifunctional YncE family protein/alkaline phosphatase family protein [Candidatus Babeliales bacterium]